MWQLFPVHQSSFELLSWQAIVCVNESGRDVKNDSTGILLSPTFRSARSLQHRRLPLPVRGWPFGAGPPHQTESASLGHGSARPSQCTPLQPHHTLEFWKRFRQPVVCVQEGCLVLFIAPPNGFQLFFLFQPQWNRQLSLSQLNGAQVPPVFGIVEVGHWGDRRCEIVGGYGQKSALSLDFIDLLNRPWMRSGGRRAPGVQQCRRGGTPPGPRAVREPPPRICWKQPRFCRASSRAFGSGWLG